MKFDSYHPAINLIFFTGVILCALAFNHPCALAIGGVCAFAYAFKLNGHRTLTLTAVLMAGTVAFALFFASFNHFGITVLGTNAIGNSYTAESLIVGVVWGVKLSTVCLWLSCVHTVFTSDKVVYLLGRVSPRASLVLSVVLRFIPRIELRWRHMENAQRGIGRGPSQGNLFIRTRNTVRVISGTLSWFMESALISSDSMKSRGLGLKGRTAFALYRFDGRDRAFVIALFFCGSVLFAGYALDQMTILYNPEIILNRMTALSSVFFIAYAAFCLMPLILQMAQERRFERLIHA